LLLQTRYVDVGTELFKLAYELEYKLELLKYDRQTKLIAISTSEQAGALSQGISGVRLRILKGDFAEPAEASMMLWSPREAPEEVIHATAAGELSATEEQALRDENAYYSSIGSEPENDYSTIAEVPDYKCPVCGSVSSSFNACPSCGSPPDRSCKSILS
jgi:hypothetical protein